jgi:uncharacterized protein
MEITKMNKSAKDSKMDQRSANFDRILSINWKNVSKEDFPFLRQTAEQGNAEAQYNLGMTYYCGQGVKQNYRNAAKWFHSAAEQGHAGAQYNLSFMYATGEGVPKDHYESARWVVFAAECGHADALYNKGLLYAHGKYFPNGKDYEKALHCFRSAAKQGHAEAQRYVDLMYATGTGVLEINWEAPRWIRPGCEEDDADAVIDSD